MTDDIKVPVSLDTRQAQADAKSFADSVKQAFQATAIFGQAANAVGMVIDKLHELGEAVDFVTQASEIQRLAEQRFVLVANMRHQATETILEDTQKLNAIIQRAAGVGDELSLAYERQLLSMGVYREDLEKVYLAAIGLSKAHDVNLTTAIQKMGLVATGQTTVLKKYGVELTDASEIIALYAGNAELAIAETESMAGAANVAKLAMGDLYETIGAMVNTAPSLVRYYEEQTNGIEKLQKEIIKAQPIVHAFLETFVDLASKAAGKVNELYEWTFKFTDKVSELYFLASGVVPATKAPTPTPAEDGPHYGPKPPSAQEQLRERIRQAQEEKLISDRKRRAERLKKERERQERDEEREQKEREKRVIDALKRQAAVESARETMERGREEARQQLEQERRATALEQEKKHQDNLNTILNGGLEERYKLLSKGTDTQTAVMRTAAVTAIGILNDGVAQSISAFGEAIASGDLSGMVGKISGIFGGLVGKVGDVMIALGTAALATRALALIPFLAPLVGDPVASAGAGAAAIAAGLAIKIIGSALAGAGGGGGASSGAPAGSYGRYQDVVNPGSAAGDAVRENAAKAAHMGELARNRRAAGGLSDSSASGFGGAGPSEYRTEIHIHTNSIIGGRPAHVAADLNRASLYYQRNLLGGLPR